MLKKLGLPVVALAGILTLFTPSAASAKVRWGFGVGVAPPVYTYPVNPYAAPYDPYYAPYSNYGPYTYGPSIGFGYYGGWGRGYDRDRGWEHGRFENRGSHFRSGHEGGHSGRDRH